MVKLDLELNGQTAALRLKWYSKYLLLSSFAVTVMQTCHAPAGCMAERTARLVA